MSRVLLRLGNLKKDKDEVVAHAVQFEMVSIPDFSWTREKYREISAIGCIHPMRSRHDVRLSHGVEVKCYQ